ncbi:MAG: uroporphyrinogen-III synthase [Acidobacteria bacterium]|nr:uroporphyrinogen-III synthase [Acidobacteriota bacterium]
MSAQRPLKASDAKPLQGKRILITRPREQTDEFAARLEAQDAEALIMPTIKIEGPEDWTEVDEAIERLGEYDWIVFTSSNAVDYFCQRLKSYGLSSRPKSCGVGSATAEALTAHGLHADLIPEYYTAEGVLAAFPEHLNGIRVLFPRGNLARDTVPEGLRQRGAVVDEVVVYRTITADRLDPLIVQRLQSGSIDVVTFTSSSTARNFVRLIGEKEIERLKSQFLVASIGPQTSHTLRELGLNVSIEAPASTVPALVEAVVAYFDSSKR